MFRHRCFEFGNDVLLFHEHLHSAKRSLRRSGSTATLSTCNEQQCVSLANRVSFGMRKEYPDSGATGATGVRLYNALFSDMIRSSGAVGDDDLMYFEAVFDNCPRVGWRLFVELVSAFGWRENLVQSLKALSPKVRLVMLEAMYNFTTTTPYVWGCVTSVLMWSAYVEPVRGFDASHDEALSAFSAMKLLPSSDDVSPTLECLLEGCVQTLGQLSEESDLPHSQPADWAAALVHAALDFFGSVFEPTDVSLFTPSQWLTRLAEVAQKATHTFYVKVPPRCRVTGGLAWPQVCKLLNDADSLLFREIIGGLSSCLQEGLLQDERAKHALCTTHSFCTARLAERSKRKMSPPSRTEDSLWHLVKKLHCLLSCLDSLEEAGEEPIPLLESLKAVVQKCGCGQQVAASGPVLEELTPDIERLFNAKFGVDAADLVVWIVKQPQFLQCERILDKLNCHLDVLSHPELFPVLCQAALRKGATECVKKLVLKTCDAAHPTLQKAMLFYVLSRGKYKKDGSPLMLSDYHNLIIEKRNIICESDAGEQSKAVDGLASLCMQSPYNVIEHLVDAAVSDGCFSAAAQMLIFLEVACKDRALFSSGENRRGSLAKLPKSDIHEQDLISSALLKAFESCLGAQDLKRKENFVRLLVELVGHSSVVPCDLLLFQMARNIKQATAEALNPENFFAVKVCMAIAPKISKDYVAPLALMLIDLLDKSCRHLDGEQKRIMVHFLDAYLGFDDSWATQIHMPHASGAACTAVALLFQKRGLPLGALAGCTEKTFSGHLLLFDEEQWDKECREIACRHPHLKLTVVMRPYLSGSLAGATLEEWDIIMKRLRTILTIEGGTCPSTDVFIKELVQCLISCVALKLQGNCSHLFLCFARTVKECLKGGEELSGQAKQNILEALLLGLHHLPKQYFKQKLLLLADVAQRMDLPELQEKLVPVLRAAFTIQHDADEKGFDVVRNALLTLS